jgi:hypothetical protein
VSRPSYDGLVLCLRLRIPPVVVVGWLASAPQPSSKRGGGLVGWGGWGGWVGWVGWGGVAYAGGGVWGVGCGVWGVGTFILPIMA